MHRRQSDAFESRRGKYIVEAWEKKRKKEKKELVLEKEEEEELGTEEELGGRS